MNVSIVTPWWNHDDLLMTYGLSLSNAKSYGHEIIVVDDCSDPPLDFAHIRMDERSGFARCCNAGLAEATREAVLFLNNDVKATREDWLQKLVAKFEPGFLVGARMRFDRHGDVDGERYPYLDGYCLGGMTEEIRSLGGFSEDYEEPAYYSDNDLCLRARLAGMSLREVRVGLEHTPGTTTGPADDPAKIRVTEANYLTYQAKVREWLGVAA